MHMLEYTKWEDWSLTTTKGVQCPVSLKALDTLGNYSKLVDVKFASG